jgi:hypothetical protein
MKIAKMHAYKLSYINEFLYGYMLTNVYTCFWADRGVTALKLDFSVDRVMFGNKVSFLNDKKTLVNNLVTKSFYEVGLRSPVAGTRK